MWLTETQLAGQIESQIPRNAPTAFLIDVQPQQWEGVRDVLVEHGAEWLSIGPDQLLGHPAPGHPIGWTDRRVVLCHRDHGGQPARPSLHR